jgi:hypothetical protein
MKPVRVYWVNGHDGSIGSDIATAFTKDCVGFADGGWNPIEETFLTERQARKAARLAEPVPKLKKVAIKTAVDLSKIIERIENCVGETNQ